MITTVIFDLGEVYLQGGLGSEKYFQELLKVPVSFDNLDIPELYDMLHGKITEDIYWQAIAKKNAWDIPLDVLKATVRKIFQEIKGTRKIIEQVKKRGYTLGLISNHAKEWIEFCEEKYLYHQLFDSYTYSYEIGVSKPNKEIFLEALKRLKVNAGECLFIDDFLQNTTAAKALGFQTIRFINAKQLESDLKKLNIL